MSETAMTESAETPTEAHRVVFNIGSGHVVCACGWVGVSDRLTGMDGVQKFGGHLRFVLAEECGSRTRGGA